MPLFCSENKGSGSEDGRDAGTIVSFCDTVALVVPAFVMEKINATTTAVMQPAMRTILDARFIVNSE